MIKYFDLPTSFFLILLAWDCHTIWWEFGFGSHTSTQHRIRGLISHRCFHPQSRRDSVSRHSSSVCELRFPDPPPLCGFSPYQRAQGFCNKNTGTGPSQSRNLSPQKHSDFLASIPTLLTWNLHSQHLEIFLSSFLSFMYAKQISIIYYLMFSCLWVRRASHLCSVSHIDWWDMWKSFILAFLNFLF